MKPPKVIRLRVQKHSVFGIELRVRQKAGTATEECQKY
jgi:hypothetical protein